LQEDTTMPTTTYGPFSFDGVSVKGPKEYMAARGVKLLDAILADEDAGYDRVAALDPQGLLGLGPGRGP
jgi:hypothetical protein